MIQAVMVMGGLGVVIGAVLAVASKVFYVYVDPKILEVEAALPGANCGGCGLPGCSANAEAIVAGKAGPDSCVAGGPDLAAAIAQIMGVSVEAKEPDIAKPGCYFGVADADQKYVYDGLNDCRAAAMLSGGMKVCKIGCLGLGTCAKFCPFDAIEMGPEGLPVVSEEKCTGCGTCERVCPKHIINLSSVTRRILREYTTQECTTPCQRRCPAGIDIREYVHQIHLGDFHRAVQVIKERNPFPAVIGRICPRPCEEDCRRQLADEPVAINFLKRFAADYEKASGERIQPYKAPATGRKIAVVGGGVQGLSTAFFTARLGHSPTVYEATSKPGGLLRTAISSLRLPAEVLDWDIQGVVEMGVEIKTGQVLGKDIFISELLAEEFEAVFLASGGWDSRLARERETKHVSRVEEAVPGTHLLLDLMRYSEDIDLKEKKVIIAGGGKAALEAARLAKERGAASVTVLFREGFEENPAGRFDPEALAAEDIHIAYESAVLRLIGEKERLTHVECMNLGDDSRKMYDADRLFFASGRYPQLIFKRLAASDADEPNEEQSDVLRWEGFQPYKQPDFAEETGMLSSGEALSDFSGAIRAIGAGRRAAVSIHQSIYGIAPDLPENVITSYSLLQNVTQVERVTLIPRQIMPLCRPDEMTECNEIEKGFDEAAARKEAGRCLQCGLICYERSDSTPAEERQKTAVA